MTSPRLRTLYAPAVVESTRALSPSVRLIRFRVVSGQEGTAALALAGLPRIALPDADWAHTGTPLEYAAGQWVDLAVPGESRVGGFSLVSIPDAPAVLLAAIDTAPTGTFDLAVKRARTPAALWAHSAEPGAPCAVRVGGAFCIDKALRGGGGKNSWRVSHAVFVAGGVGINPLYAMLLALAAARALGDFHAPRATLFYTAAKCDELLFREELAALASGPLAGALDLRLAVTRETLPPKGLLASGRVTSSQIAAALVGGGGAANTAVVICGPPAMADAVAATARTAGVAENNVILERWW